MLGSVLPLLFTLLNLVRIFIIGEVISIMKIVVILILLKGFIFLEGCGLSLVARSGDALEEVATR